MVSQDVVKQHVSTAVRKADLTTVSAKQVRRTVEKQLNLEQDELASGKWKILVKSVIEETMAAIERGDPDPQEEGSEDEVVRMFFRGGCWLLEKKGRRKKAVIEVTPTSSPVKSKVRSPAQFPIVERTVATSKDASASPPKKKRKSMQDDPTHLKKQKSVQDDQSDSDMSVLIDSTPPVTKARKQDKDPSRPTKSTTKTTAKSTDTAKAITSSSEDEIKNLKSLVFKCGARKNWLFL